MKVSHGDIAYYANEKINLPQDKANEYRAQVRRLREKLENYLGENPDFSLRKMLISGSLAKGTALRTINDIDVACYITGSDAPSDVADLLDYLVEKLKTAFPNFSSDQVTANTYSVTVSFRGSGLDVDVVPILYDGDPDWYGKVVSQEDGSYLSTCIPRHIEFIRKRKQKQNRHFAQVIRLLKAWKNHAKEEYSHFRFKSFMIELILTKLVDDGLDCSDYPETMQAFFTYIITSNLRDKTYFTDYYTASSVGTFAEPIQIIDPVNAENNAAKLYMTWERDAIIDAATDAGDAIDSARFAASKADAVYYWQKVFGPTFKI